jgi:hypothetical protein
MSDTSRDKPSLEGRCQKEKLDDGLKFGFSVEKLDDYLDHAGQSPSDVMNKYGEDGMKPCDADDIGNGN